jgi:hypothetical protein
MPNASGVRVMRSEDLEGDKVAVSTGRHAPGYLQQGGRFARNVLGVENQDRRRSMSQPKPRGPYRKINGFFIMDVCPIE